MASTILFEQHLLYKDTDHYDVFLSHSFDDSEIILGIKMIAEANGVRVYVDWVDDGQLDRNHVTADTAKILRKRMGASASLVYAHSPNTLDSRWMPWELGYFDGLRPGRVWILPLVAKEDKEFKSQEYLGFYPIIERIESISGSISIGFKSAEIYHRIKDVPLAEAAKNPYFTARLS